MKPRFLRMRRKRRGVLVLPNHLSGLAPDLRRKNFYPIVLPAEPLDQQHKEWWLPGRTLITDKPEELEGDDIPALEFSVIDITKFKGSEATLANIISALWTRSRLKTEGWFVLRLRSNGTHEVEFPESVSRNSNHAERSSLDAIAVLDLFNRNTCCESSRTNDIYRSSRIAKVAVPRS
jgi:hypothetical protein